MMTIKTDLAVAYSSATAVTLVTLLATSLIFLPTNSSAQSGFPETQLAIIDSANPVVIDGNINDVIWQTAPIISNFHQIRPTDKGNPSQRTEVQLARDSQYIYVAFKAFDTNVSTLSAKGLIQGQNYFSDDRFAVYIDTFNDRRNSYFLQTNANGIRRDALFGNDYFIEDWSTVWHVETKVHDWGWSGEMAIPIRSISFDPNAKQWGINFGRVYPRNGEEMAWSSSNRSNKPAVSGYLNGVEGFSQGIGLELSPSIALIAEDDSKGQRSENIEPSLTGFYNITPFLTAGLTFNTDFSATDVDDVQVNLNRFSLFFPEKREFFLRDASIFEFGNIDQNGRPFFSRKIGLSGDGRPLEIDVGARLSGRAGDWNIGALAIKQEAGITGGDEDLLVARASRNVFEESDFGFIATKGDPNSDLDNSLMGVDYNYRTTRFKGDKRLNANAWYQESNTQGVNVGQTAYGFGISYPNDKWDGYMDYRRIEDNFNPALGFVNRRGVELVDSQMRYRHRLDNGFWQWLGGRAQYFRADTINGSIQSQSAFIHPLEGQSKRNDFFTFFVGQTKEGVIETFQLPNDIQITPGLYTSDRYGVYVETGFQRPLRMELEIADGDFFGGTRLEIRPEIEWRPNKHWLASVSMSQNHIELPQGEFTSRVFSAKLNYAFSSRWALLSLVQADNGSNTVSINSRLRYQPRADREYLLVFNQSRDRITDETLDTSIVFKAQWNFRF